MKDRIAAQDPNVRVALFEKDFLGFYDYYFERYITFDNPNYLKKVAYDLEAGYNVYCAGFTGSGKTTLTQAFVIRKAVFKKSKFIVRYSHSLDDASDNMTDISNEFIDNDRLVEDFGQLYFGEETKTKFGRKEPKKISKFTLTSGVTFHAYSLGKSSRGKSKSTKEGRNRPDLMIFDDIENNITLQSLKVTKKNWSNMSEALGRITNGQVIFLGNVIKDRGLVMWTKELAEQKPNRRVHRIPIYDKDGNIVFTKYVETIEEADKYNAGIDDVNSKVIPLEKIKSDLDNPVDNRNTFDQEYLLLAESEGDPILIRENIKYKGFMSYKDKKDKTYMGIDPAESEKTASDPIGIVIVLWKRSIKGYTKHILFHRRIKGKEKHLKFVGQIISDLYKDYKVDMCRYENKAGGKTLAGHIEMKYKVPYELMNPSTDKVMRLKKVVPQFNNGEIFFNPGMSKDLETEALRFPNYPTDDLVDAMVYAIMGNISRGISRISSVMESRSKGRRSILDRYK